MAFFSRVNKISVIVMMSVALAATLTRAEDVVLVRDQASVGRIVIPDHPLPVERFAADELQYHIEKASGAILPVVSESELTGADGNLVYVGHCQKTKALGIASDDLPANAFRIKVQDGNLFLIGHDSEGSVLDSNGIKGRLHTNRTRVGTLFAVYEFLEKHLGVRWLWPGSLGEMVPAHRSIAVSQWDQIHEPVLLTSRLRDYANRTGRGWNSEKTREQFFVDQAIWMRRHRFAQGLDIDYGHAFVTYWERFGAEHPEYFAQRPDGVRKPAGQNQHVQMCVSEPGLWKLIVKEWQRRGDPWINGAENDYHSGPKGDPACHCENCQAWDVPGQTSMSDRYAKFWLALQREGEKIQPDVKVIGYAYGRSNEPPIRTKLNDRIVISIVPQFYFPWTPDVRDKFRKQWQGWSDAGAQLNLRPNYFLDGHNFPIYFADQFSEDFSFAAERGMLTTDFDSLTGQWATHGPNLYVLGRVHEHPEMSVDEILDEYYAAFGPAEQAVRNYFAHWKRNSDSITAEYYEQAWQSRKAHGVPDNPEHRLFLWADALFSPSTMQQGRELIDVAIRQAKGDAQAEARVAFLEKGLTNVEHTLRTSEAYARYKETGKIDAFLASLRKLDQYRQSVEADMVANMGYLADKEAMAWDRSLLDEK